MYQVLLTMVVCYAALCCSNRSAIGVEVTTMKEVKREAEKEDGQPQPANFCECAAFNKSQPTSDDEAIMRQSTMNVNCDSDGEKACTMLCSALALAAHDDAPKYLCDAVGHCKNLEVFLHSRICNSPTWTFTGLTRNNICCHDHNVVDCE